VAMFCDVGMTGFTGLTGEKERQAGYPSASSDGISFCLFTFTLVRLSPASSSCLLRLLATFAFTFTFLLLPFYLFRERETVQPEAAKDGTRRLFTRSSLQ
jgi:hypothetical protein